MVEGYSSNSACTACVCYHACCYVPGAHGKVPLGFLWYFQDMNCVDFVENAIFKSSGDICGLARPLGKLMKEITIASFQDLY